MLDLLDGKRISVSGERVPVKIFRNDKEACRAVEGDVSSAVAASFLQEHPLATFYADFVREFNRIFGLTPKQSAATAFNRSRSSRLMRISMAIRSPSPNPGSGHFRFAQTRHYCSVENTPLPWERVAQPGEGAVGAATTAPSPYPLPKEREKKEIFSTEQG
jgi:hypothetical protein